MVQEWWNDIVQWFGSSAGRTVVSNVILPFIAVIIGAVVASLIVRSSLKRLVAQRDREHKAAAVAALIAAGRRAATWNALSAQEKDHVDHQLSEAEVRVRLLPLPGAGLAADWTAHQLAAMKKNSANFSFQADQDLIDMRDGLIAWQEKPARARKLFAQDLATWKYDTGVTEDELVTKQREWAAAQPSVTEPTSVIPMAAADKN